MLPFSRPMYNQAKLASATGKLSISGIQTKMSVALRDTQLEMTESGGQYILKPIPHGEFQRSGHCPSQRTPDNANCPSSLCISASPKMHWSL